MTKLKSAAGVLALLNDPDGRVQSRALEMLLPIVDLFWAEIAESVDVIEGLSEEEDFGKRELAAAVASKCFYHLEDYDEALRLAPWSRIVL